MDHNGLDFPCLPTLSNRILDGLVKPTIMATPAVLGEARFRRRIRAAILAKLEHGPGPEFPRGSGEDGLLQWPRFRNGMPRLC